MPVPESVPLRVKMVIAGVALSSLRLTVGLAPRGKEQSLPTVRETSFSPTLFMVTALKVTLLQERVAGDDVPSKVTVPELWVKVPPVMVKLFATVMVPEGAVNIPEESVKAALRSNVV